MKHEMKNPCPVHRENTDSVLSFIILLYVLWAGHKERLVLWNLFSLPIIPFIYSFLFHDTMLLLPHLYWSRHEPSPTITCVWIIPYGFVIMGQVFNDFAISSWLSGPFHVLEPWLTANVSHILPRVVNWRSGACLLSTAPSLNVL